VGRSAHEKIVAKGQWGVVECAVRPNGKMPALDFLYELEDIREKAGNNPQNTAAARFVALFDWMANHGPQAMPPARYSSEMKGLWAFKHEIRNKQIRFPCFNDGNKCILTHGFFKPGAQKGKGKWPDAEIKKAFQIKAEYFQQK
jgi:hypothetical protein